jgi:hypothetical protein
MTKPKMHTFLARSVHPVSELDEELLRSIIAVAPHREHNVADSAAAGFQQSRQNLGRRMIPTDDPIEFLPDKRPVVRPDVPQKTSAIFVRQTSGVGSV